jgi:hypothetical protein
MEKLITKVNALLGKLYIPCRVPADKQAHALSGFIIAIALAQFIGFYAVTAVAIIALVKEVYDYCNADKHTADLWDWIATVLGGLVGFVVIALF